MQGWAAEGEERAKLPSPALVSVIPIQMSSKKVLLLQIIIGKFLLVPVNKALVSKNKIAFIGDFPVFC
jgi:hypothetical protein